MASFDTDTQIPPLQTGEDLAFSKALELVYGSALPMAMHAAIDLGVFDILASAGPEAKLSAADIAAKMPTENPEAPAMLDRICTLLVHDCVLDYAISKPKCAFADTSWLYCLNPVSKYFVRNQDGVSLAPILTLIQDNVDMDTWLVSFYPFFRSLSLSLCLPFFPCFSNDSLFLILPSWVIWGSWYTLGTYNETMHVCPTTDVRSHSIR